MKITRLYYKEHGGSIIITGFENAMDLTGLYKYFANKGVLDAGEAVGRYLTDESFAGPEFCYYNDWVEDRLVLSTAKNTMVTGEFGRFRVWYRDESKVRIVKNWLPCGGRRYIGTKKDLEGFVDQMRQAGERLFRMVLECQERKVIKI